MTRPLRQKAAHIEQEVTTEQEATPNDKESPFRLSNDERMILDRYRNRLHQVVWALLTCAEFRFNHDTLRETKNAEARRIAELRTEVPGIGWEAVGFRFEFDDDRTIFQ